jgi:hypothetical protein
VILTAEGISNMINKSPGVTDTERLLSNLGDNTFLNLWSYPNPIKDDGKEACDLLAVFENHVFIFFDREKILSEQFFDNPEVLWRRWVSDVIDAQIQTCYGAEKYIKSGRKLFLDKKMTVEFPVKFDSNSAVVHKIIVAHGASMVCKKASDANVNGSLAITYCDKEKKSERSKWPFSIELDKKRPVHVFDSHTLPILLSELDTFYDFKSYLVEKEEAIKRHDLIIYAGEEDLLAHYFQNHTDSKVHAIGFDDDTNAIMITEGMWNDFITTESYQAKMEANKSSYLWDRIIQKTCNFTLKGLCGGNSDAFANKAAIYEMAKEPRFVRRGLADHMLAAIDKFPNTDDQFMRYACIMPSFHPNKSYIFLQLKNPGGKFSYDQYREIRLNMLEVACCAAKVKLQTLEMVIGIGVEPVKYNKRLSEDFILLDCSTWSSEEYTFYDNENKRTGLNFFLTKDMKETHKTITEFPV